MHQVNGQGKGRGTSFPMLGENPVHPIERVGLHGSGRICQHSVGAKRESATLKMSQLDFEVAKIERVQWENKAVMKGLIKGIQ